MHLTGQQQEALLLNRRSHLQRMRSIYQERHNLNMQVGRGGGGGARARAVCVSPPGAQVAKLAAFLLRGAVGLSSVHSLGWPPVTPPPIPASRPLAIAMLGASSSQTPTPTPNPKPQPHAHTPPPTHPHPSLTTPPRCRQAMALMLPHSSHNPAEDNTVEGRMTSMSHSGYLPLARSSAELSNVLDKIKVGGGWRGRGGRGAACVGCCGGTVREWRFAG